MIIYATRYGSAAQYAKWIQEETNEELFSIDQLSDQESDSITFVTSLYAGGLLGSQKLKRYLAAHPLPLQIVTVGIADPSLEKNRKEIEKNVHALFDPYPYTLYCLRGKIDYMHLSLKHRLMMWMLKTMIEKRGHIDENVEFLATYGKQADFMDKEQIKKIVKKE